MVLIITFSDKVLDASVYGDFCLLGGGGEGSRGYAYMYIKVILIELGSLPDSISISSPGLI